MGTMLAPLVAVFAAILACEAYYRNDDRYDRYNYRNNRYPYRTSIYRPYVSPFEDFYDVNYGYPDTEYRRFEYGRNTYGGRNKGSEGKNGKSSSGREQSETKGGMDVIVEQKPDSGHDVKFGGPDVIGAPKIDIGGSERGRGNQNFRHRFAPERPINNQGESHFGNGRRFAGPRGEGPDFDSFPDQSALSVDRQRGPSRHDDFTIGQGQGPLSDLDSGRGSQFRGSGSSRVDPNTEQRGSFGVSGTNSDGGGTGRENLRESALIGSPNSAIPNQGAIAPRGGGDEPLLPGRGPVRGDPDAKLQPRADQFEPNQRPEFEKNPRNPPQRPRSSPIVASGRFDPIEDGSSIDNRGNDDSIKLLDNERRFNKNNANPGTGRFPSPRPSDGPGLAHGQLGSPNGGTSIPPPDGPGGSRDAGRPGRDGRGRGSGGDRRGGGPDSGFPGSRPSVPISGSAADFQHDTQDGGVSVGENDDFR